MPLQNKYSIIIAKNKGQDDFAVILPRKAYFIGQLLLSVSACRMLAGRFCRITSRLVWAEVSASSK